MGFKNLDRIWIKLLAVCLSFSLPIAVMLVLMIQAKNKDIDFAAFEILGNKYQRPLELLLQDISLHKINTFRVLNGEKNFQKDVEQLSNSIDEKIQKLLSVDKEIGVDLQFTDEGLEKRKRSEFRAQNLDKKWQELKAQFSGLTPDTSTEIHDKLITHIRTMITHAGDTSNLILDPDLDSYYLMDVTLLALPQIQERLEKIISFIDKISLKSEISRADQIQASVYKSLLQESDWDRTAASSQTSVLEDQNFYGVSASLQKNLPSQIEKNKPLIEEILKRLQTIAEMSSTANFDKIGFRTASEDALKSIYDLHSVAFDELDILLNVRKDVFTQSIYTAIVLTSIALLFSALLALLITRNLLKRVKHFQSVTKLISGGQLDAHVYLQGSDELTELANSFDSMTENLQKLTSEIAAKNADLKNINQNLENIVIERTQAIRNILDNVTFGLFIADEKLCVKEGYSKSCEDFFKNKKSASLQGSFLPTLLNLNERDSTNFESLYSQVCEDEMGLTDIAISQLPTRFAIGDRMISLTGSPIKSANNKVTSVLFCVADISALVKAEKEIIENRSLLKILESKNRFSSLVQNMLKKIQFMSGKVNIEPEISKLVRLEVHTWKGGMAHFGLSDVATAIHHIESKSTIGDDDLKEIEGRVLEYLQKNFRILQLRAEAQESNVFIVPASELLLLDKAVRQASNVTEVKKQIQNFLREAMARPVSDMVGVFQEEYLGLAKRLEKKINFQLFGESIKVPHYLEPIFQNITHLVRNAVDHGIELPRDRDNKPVEGNVVLAVSEDVAHWTISVSDDGRGIDSALLCQKALEKGLKTQKELDAMNEHEKLNLIFNAGFSTTKEVTDISGRGVGMGAVLEAVKSLGGTIEVRTILGSGTTVQMNVPKREQEG